MSKISNNLKILDGKYKAYIIGVIIMFPLMYTYNVTQGNIESSINVATYIVLPVAILNGVFATTLTFTYLAERYIDKKRKMEIKTLVTSSIMVLCQSFMFIYKILEYQLKQL